MVTVYSVYRANVIITMQYKLLRNIYRFTFKHVILRRASAKEFVDKLQNGSCGGATRGRLKRRLSTFLIKFGAELRLIYSIAHVFCCLRRVLSAAGNYIAIMPNFILYLQNCITFRIIYQADGLGSISLNSSFVFLRSRAAIVQSTCLI